MREEVWHSNYQSVDEHLDFVYQHFDEECVEGLMEKLTLQQAKERYGIKSHIFCGRTTPREASDHTRRHYGTMVNNGSGVGTR